MVDAHRVVSISDLNVSVIDLPCIVQTCKTIDGLKKCILKKMI
jgi:hypothetical protein